ncbi:mismatch repair protein [Leishmania major strain Friedlin]|uniref:Mismatch repair protein n=1 Tax=Leishmania major TaxID=5664 RepID=E9AEY8_LEIMA|nr:mismatch repair protein [Leishmania major strain Friedlin]CAG9582517.1 mismatch_repair_protein_PMS1_-_putative [Leishmania major strain Friedlin]CBZ12792.1 mismatch repair protein [Leishmania major strain Friedlin]|eukprot:XP_003722558.1 mismatch repair protein [Leishmania major strain Friedlin]
MITRLDGASARKLAAGQVITDLTSVVKELSENALDAKATTVTIRLINYGLDEIVVDDDGTGISMGQLVNTAANELLDGASTPLLSSRATTKQRRHDLDGCTHATAKDEADEGRTSQDESACVAEAEGDSSDPSLGFRGEALHSLAHMSDVTVETRSADTGALTVRISYDHTSHTSRLEAVRLRDVCGTTVTARHLFKHFPVRHREYVKNCRKQLSKATSTMKQYAVSHPHIRLLMQHQETPNSAVVTLVSLTGSGDATRSVTEAYGGLCTSHMQRVHWSLSFGTFTGLVSKVSGGGRLSSDHQVFALDGRLVDLPRLGKALNDAFIQCLPNASQRLYVAFFLQVKRNASLQYDVNLTPNKRKVLLAQEERLADEVYQCALQEFGSALQEVDLDRGQRIAQTRAADVRATELTRLTRTPVSATSLTQLTFKRAKMEETYTGGRVAAGALDAHSGESHLSPTAGSSSVIDLPKLGSFLYANDAADNNGAGTDGDGERDESTPLLLPSSPSSISGGDGDDEDSKESSRSAVEDKGKGSDPPALKSTADVDDHGDCCCGRYLADNAEGMRSDSVAVEVTRLCDEGSQRRGGGSCYQCTYPDLGELVREPFSADPADAVVLSASTQTCDRPSSRTLGAQTADDLNHYFTKNSFKEMRVIGQFNHGFIIAVLPNGDVFVVDQHASDEKYNYERLVRAYEATPQPLVMPVSVAMSAHEVDLAVEHKLALQHHGFKVSRGSDDTKLLVYSLPVLPYDVVSASDVMELVQQLVQYGTITKPLRAVWHSMATKACRSSIMIGTPLTVKRMKLILERLSQLDQPWNCPHGRPTLRLLCNIVDLSRGGALLR